MNKTDAHLLNKLLLSGVSQIPALERKRSLLSFKADKRLASISRVDGWCVVYKRHKRGQCYPEPIHLFALYGHGDRRATHVAALQAGPPGGAGS